MNYFAQIEQLLPGRDASSEIFLKCFAFVSYTLKTFNQIIFT